MAVNTSISRPMPDGVRAGTLRTMLVALTLVAGLVLATAIGLRLVSGAGTQGPGFDAVQFRAQERTELAVQAPFDAAQFRAGERSVTVPTWDAAKFRAEEKLP
jgi:hypothetical protein